MQTPSKNSISSFSVQVEYTNQTLRLSLRTCARPGQATDPDNVVFHTSRSYQGRWVRNRRAVVCLCTGCHPEEASLAVAAAAQEDLFDFLSKRRDADNGGRELRNAQGSGAVSSLFFFFPKMTDQQYSQLDPGHLACRTQLPLPGPVAVVFAVRVLIVVVLFVVVLFAVVLIIVVIVVVVLIVVVLVLIFLVVIFLVVNFLDVFL